MVRCFYINLESAKNRKKDLESDFLRNKTKNFQLTRIQAIHAKEIGENKGQITKTDRAVNRSHLKALKEAQKATEISAIMEDDTFFFKETFPILERLIRKIPDSPPIVIYTDIMVTTPNWIAEFQRNYERRKLRLKDLKYVQYAGASFYIANRSAIEVMIPYALANLDSQPWDMTMRSLVHKGLLTGKVTTPFLTSVNANADNSDNQPPELQSTDLVWNTYRRSISLHPELFPIRESLHRIRKEYKLSTLNTVSCILAAHASKQFRKK